MATPEQKEALKKILPISAMNSIVEMADRRTEYKLSDKELVSYIKQQVAQQTYIAKNWIRALVVRGEIKL